MTLSLSHLEQYAKTKGTKVIAHKIAPDYKSAVFVLESGPKLTMTEEEIKKAIQPKEKAETPAEKKARLKAEAEANAKAEAEAEKKS